MLTADPKNRHYDNGFNGAPSLLLKLLIVMGVVGTLAAWVMGVPGIALCVDILLVAVLILALVVLVIAIVLSIPISAVATGISLLPLPRIPLSYNFRNLTVRWI